MEPAVQAPDVSLCTFCLRKNTWNTEFYHYDPDKFDEEFRLSIQSILGYDIRLDNFTICKPCWSLAKLLHDFRTCFRKAYGLVERIGQGWKCDWDDGWFAEENVKAIEGIQRMVLDRLVQIEGIDDIGQDTHLGAVPDIVKIKTEPVEDIAVEEPTASGHVFESALDIGAVKVERAELDDEDRSDNDVSDNDMSDNDMSDNDMETESEDGSQKGKLGGFALGLFTCEKCDRTFDSASGIKHHSKKCDGTKGLCPYVCRICSVTFDRPYKLNQHMNKHSDARPFKCKLCGKGYNAPQTRQRHEALCVPDEKKCILCEEVLANGKLLKAHYRFVHPGQPKHPCPKCDRWFRSRTHLQSHLRRIHAENRVRNLPCSFCGKLFAEAPDLKVHEKIHTGVRIKKVQCPHCDMTFVGNAVMQVHVARKHPEAATAQGMQAAYRINESRKTRRREKKVKQEVDT